MKWIWILALAACGGSDAPRTTPLWSDGEHLRDARGRIALLRGINARVEGVFDVTFDDGRIPVEEIPALVPAECARMRALGLDLLRLPINWSGIEPMRDQIDEAYLARVDAAIACAASAGLYVVVDVHQDAYSKEIGEDGAPLWAIVPPPDMLLQGPLMDLSERRTSAQVVRAFDSFFEIGDPHALQREFFDMLEIVARRWGEHPAVIGFELFNEPIATEDELRAFHEGGAARVREAAPGKLVFFEPSSLRNFTDAAPLAKTPFAVDGAVYSPHIYTFVFSSDRGPLERLKAEDLVLSVEDARTEARAWKTPLFIGEFGIGPNDPNADLWIGTQAELHDRLLASNAIWLWRETSQGSWGLYDADGSERPRVLAWLSRIHAARIAGDVVRNAWDHVTERLVLETKGGDAPHVIYIPERQATTFRATCNGTATPAPRDTATGLVEIACDGTLAIDP